MHKYRCQVAPNDTLIAYSTDVESEEILFALVAENLTHKQKVSVLLNKEDAQLLRDQLDAYLKGDNHGLL